MKYLDERVEDLELEVKLLKAQIKLQETKTTGFVDKQPIRLGKKDTSHYLNNYPPTPDWRNKEINDYMFNPITNLMSEPDLETTFASPWNSSEIKNSLDTIAVNLSSIADHNFPNLDYVDSSDLPEYYPPYPNIIGSWDDYDGNVDNDLVSFNQTDKIPPYPGHFNTISCSDDKSFNDVLNENVTDDCGFKMNYEEPITTWGFESEFDKQDKDFLKYLNSTEKKIEKLYGKIISKFKFLNHQWEMDGYGYVINTGNDKKIIVTNHGKPIAVDKSYIETKISEYKEVIQETQRALFLIK